MNTLIRKTKRDPSGNTRYHLEHSQPVTSTQQSLLPNSNMFADTTATLGVASRGFHFTGETTENSNAGMGTVHSSKSLLYDKRDDTESFIYARNGAQTNPAFKDAPVPQTTGPVPAGVNFTPSTAEPAAQGQGGTGPSWWDRIKSNFRRDSTQSSNLGTKPPEKFQVGLTAGNQVVVAQNRTTGAGPQGVGNNNAPQFNPGAHLGGLGT